MTRQDIANMLNRIKATMQEPLPMRETDFMLVRRSTFQALADALRELSTHAATTTPDGDSEEVEGGSVRPAGNTKH